MNADRRSPHRREIGHDACVVRSRDEPGDLETVEPSPTDAPAPRAKVRMLRAKVSRSTFIATGAVLLGAAVGSAITVVVDRDDRSAQPTAAAASTITTVASVPPNLVTRLRQPTRLDSWSIVATDFQRADTFDNVTAPAQHLWLVVYLKIANVGPTASSFDSRHVVARYFEEGTQPEVPATYNEQLLVQPRAVLPMVLAFSVPTSSQTFSIVIRKDLEAEKQAGTAVEIDLNCC
jgi:hypothetical protein